MKEYIEDGKQYANLCITTWIKAIVENAVEVRMLRQGLQCLTFFFLNLRIPFSQRRSDEDLESRERMTCWPHPPVVDGQR